MGTKQRRAQSPRLALLVTVVFKSSSLEQVSMVLCKVGHKWAIKRTVRYWCVCFILLSAGAGTFPVHSHTPVYGFSINHAASLWDCFLRGVTHHVIKTESAELFGTFFHYYWWRHLRSVQLVSLEMSTGKINVVITTSKNGNMQTVIELQVVKGESSEQLPCKQQSTGAITFFPILHYAGSELWHDWLNLCLSVLT